MSESYVGSRVHLSGGDWLRAQGELSTLPVAQRAVACSNRSGTIVVLEGSWETGLTGEGGSLPTYHQHNNDEVQLGQCENTVRSPRGLTRHGQGAL